MAERHDPGHAPHDAHGEGHSGFDGELQIRPILKAGLWTIAVSAVSFVGMILLYRGLSQAEHRADPAASPIPEASVRQMPPEPRLQPAPERELATLRLEQKTLLGNYGWVDRPAGIARIPIDRAIDLVAQRGLPQPAPVSPAADPGAAASR